MSLTQSPEGSIFSQYTKTTENEFKIVLKITIKKGVIFLFTDCFINFSAYSKINFHKDLMLEFREKGKNLKLELPNISSQQLEKHEMLFHGRTEEVLVCWLNHIK